MGDGEDTGRLSDLLFIYLKEAFLRVVLAGLKLGS